VKKKRKQISLYLLPEQDQKLSRLAADKVMSKGKVVEFLLGRVKEPKLNDLPSPEHA